MTDFLSKWILIFTLSLAFTGDCFAQSPVTEPTLPITDCTQVQSPQNLSELLVRIKSALETGFLRRKNFYTEESLKHCFGGQKVTWSNNDANNKVGEVSGFGNLVPRVGIAGITVDGLALFFKYHAQANGKSTGAWQLEITGKASVDFQTVERIFGRGWGIDPPSPPSIHNVERVPTRDHGNDNISYRSRSGNESWQAHFKFDENANVSGATFIIEGI